MIVLVPLKIQRRREIFIFHQIKEMSSYSRGTLLYIRMHIIDYISGRVPRTRMDRILWMARTDLKVLSTEFLCLYNTKRNKYNCFKFKLRERKWLKFENWLLTIYIRIIKHYTDIVGGHRASYGDDEQHGVQYFINFQWIINKVFHPNYQALY
jgi:hypothetical protein